MKPRKPNPLADPRSPEFQADLRKYQAVDDSRLLSRQDLAVQLLKRLGPARGASSALDPNTPQGRQKIRYLKTLENL